MKFGLFVQPLHPPGTDIRAAIEWDLQVIRWADEYGFSEAWVGEHYTIGWEPVPSPDILIAQALRETKQIKLAPGVHLLPYHHPAELAHRIAFLDHLAQGRYILGVGAGAFVSDADLFGTNGQNGAMMLESLEIMHRIWEADGPFEYRGKFWSVKYPSYDPLTGGPFLKPFQKPRPPIAMAGLSPNSGTLHQAGKLGFLPLSLNLSPKYIAGHWDAYVKGAAEGGHNVSRKDWRIGREFFVADTDEEAYRHATGPHLGRAGREFLLASMKKFGMMKHLAPDSSVAESDITVEYLAKNVWLVGSPETVAAKLRAHYKEAGGFGTQLGIMADHSADPEPFRRSLELMAKEVLPRVKDLTGE
jgi:alkanesulfonate monooxygenase SsuD/methylene tetrahydromethanopterin reductase-like flavin-dependent oxidoreductase (luciferase family)